MDEVPKEPLAKDAKAKSWWYRFRWLLIGIGIFLVLAVCGAFSWLYFFDRQNPDALPNSVLGQIKGFDPYYFKPTFSTDFKLQHGSESYANGVLIFSMKNIVGKKLIFTEEKTPPHFDPTSLNTSSQYNTQYGRELIVDDADRTVGTMFTADNTWVVVNAPNPIGASAMRTIVEALVPLKPSN